MAGRLLSHVSRFHNRVPSCTSSAQLLPFCTPVSECRPGSPGKLCHMSSLDQHTLDQFVDLEIFRLAEKVGVYAEVCVQTDIEM